MHGQSSGTACVMVGVTLLVGVTMGGSCVTPVGRVPPQLVLKCDMHGLYSQDGRNMCATKALTAAAI